MSTTSTPFDPTALSVDELVQLGDAIERAREEQARHRFEAAQRQRLAAQRDDARREIERLESELPDLQQRRDELESALAELEHRRELAAEDGNRQPVAEEIEEAIHAVRFGVEWLQGVGLHESGGQSAISLPHVPAALDEVLPDEDWRAFNRRSLASVEARLAEIKKRTDSLRPRAAAA